MSEKRFDKLDEKIDDLKSEMSELKTVVSTGFAVYNKQLEIHIAATEQNRNEIKFIKEDIEPLKDNFKFLKKLGMLAASTITILGIIAGIIFGLLEVFGV